MKYITLPNGYNGETVECETEPIEKDGDLYKLRVKDSHLIRWCTKSKWETAMQDAYIAEMYENLKQEQAREFEKATRQDEYRAWMKEETK